MKQDKFLIKFGTIAVLALWVMDVKANTDVTSKGEQNIAEIIKSDKDLSIFAKSLEKSGMDHLLEGEGPYTVFVSNNAAYDKVSFGKKLAVWRNKKLMIEILNFHIVQGVITEQDLLSMKDTILSTLEGVPLNIKKQNELKIDKAKIARMDIHASNGIVHVIDEVILPPKKSS